MRTCQVKNKDWFYYLLLTCSAIFWGSSFIFTKQLLRCAAPVTIVFTRLVIAVSVFVCISFLFFRKELRIQRKDLLTIFAFSLFEPFLYFIFETYSLTYCDAAVVSIIVATIPIATAFLSLFYFKEDFTLLNFAGVGITVIGIGTMLLPSLLNANMSVLGIILAFCAVLASVGYTFFLRKLPEHYNPVVIVCYQNFTGLLLFTPLLFIFNDVHTLPGQFTALFSGCNTFYVVMLSVLCSAMAFMFYLQGMRRFGIGKSCIFTNFIPIVTAVLSFFLLKESFPAYKIIGIITVILGIFLVQTKKRTTE